VAFTGEGAQFVGDFLVTGKIGETVQPTICLPQKAGFDA
jgi:hypothetical protein